MSDGIKATMRLSAEQVVALGRGMRSMEADRDEWRALARELGAAARHWDTGRNARNNQCDDCEAGLAAVAKLREKEERDAGR